MSGVGVVLAGLSLWYLILFKETYFDPGEQDEGSVGQGLGLYLVDTLVQRYGRDVWFEDNDPRGTVCKMRLPRA